MPSYKSKFPELAAEFERTQAGKLKDGWEKTLPVFAADAKPMATRNAGNAVMNAFAKEVPELIGGAADLTASTKTILKDGGNFHVDPKGRNIWFGVREFGMCAAVNGMAAHGGLIPYGSTFFTFTDYCKSAIRMAAIMQTQSIFVFTHDSIALGEDGPTHQPIEHLMMLRAVPQLTDFRPADANETSACLAAGAGSQEPGLLCAVATGPADCSIRETRQGFRRRKAWRVYCRAGGDSPDLLIVGTGAELWPAIQAAAELKKDGIVARIVSMPSWKLFEEQSEVVPGFDLSLTICRSWRLRPEQRWAGGSM